MSNHTILDFDESEYQNFIDLIGTDVLPPSINEQRAKNKEEIKKRSSGRGQIKTVTLDYDGYIDFNQRSGFKPDYHSLGAYAVYLSNQPA